ncbi:MAG: sigma-70 family RNA polymerase sigma factor [Bacteroidota bacterium]
MNSRNYAFNLLVKKYQQSIYYHIRRIVIDHDDTDDLVQNTFMKIYQNLDNFREDAQLYTWIYRIATNEALAFLKSKRKKFFLPFIDVELQLSNTLKDNQFFNGDEIQLKLQKAILTLPEKQRLVFNMRYYEEMKYEEMSEILGTSVGALKASYHIAAKKIEEFVKQD